jgi:hypothetical protein
MSERNNFKHVKDIFVKLNKILHEWNLYELGAITILIKIRVKEKANPKLHQDTHEQAGREHLQVASTKHSMYKPPGKKDNAILLISACKTGPMQQLLLKVNRNEIFTTQNQAVAFVSFLFGEESLLAKIFFQIYIFSLRI